ncbi:MAG: peptidyl-prolyl cis-trans isomerase, partial [Candidatus Coatesbacteria bacterium]
MKNTLYLAAGFTVALLIIGGVNCAGDKYGGVPEDEVVARVDDRVLTADDLDEMDRLQRLKKAPTYLTKEELMDDWVRSEIIYQEALKRELHKDPEIEKALVAAEKSILIQMFWQKYVYDVNPEPDDEGALEYYEKVKDRDYKAPAEMYWLRELAVTDAGVVEEVNKELAEGKNFESVAHGHSILPNKTKGGNMGYVKLSTIPPKAAEAVEVAAVGDTVGPIDMGQFIYYYKIEDHIGPGEYLKPESLDKAYLRDKAKVGTWAEKAGRLGDELYSKADVETHHEN